MGEIYQSDFLRVLHEPASRLLELEWHAPVSSAALRQGMLYGLQLAYNLHARAWICNLTDRPVVSPLDQQWIYEEWFPRFAVLGIRRLAIVELDGSPQRLGLAQMMEHAEGMVPLATAYFPTIATARAWARQQGNESSLPMKASVHPDQ